MAGGTVAKRSAGGLAEIVGSEFPALSDPDAVAEIRESLLDNVGGALGRKDLLQVPFPSGGSTSWEIPDDFGGDPTPVSEIRIVPVHYRPVRLLFPARQNGQAKLGEFPVCSSPDGVRPVINGLYGDQGERASVNQPVLLDDGLTSARTCGGCPMSQFGSAASYHGRESGGRGQACQARMMLFGLRPENGDFGGDLLPILFSCPPTSVDAFRTAMMGLLRRYPGIHYSGFVLTMKLRKVDGDNPYAELRIRPEGLLTGARSKRKGGPEEGSPAAAALAYSEGFGKLLTDDAVLSQAAASGPGHDGDGGASASYADGGDFGDAGEFGDHGDTSPA
ncbi:MAG: hypothetical protein ACRDTZ_03805 [Pseudonocardiaceae bacterium]